MAFSRRRGRKRTTAPVTRTLPDTGTPELRARRRCGQTAEPLDLCHNRGLISDEEHWAGIHFRWLYTLRYGAPTVRAIDLSETGPEIPQEENLAWRAEREQEYALAAAALQARRLLRPMLDLCIYSHPPAFLSTRPDNGFSHAAKHQHTISRINEGLSLLNETFRHYKEASRRNQRPSVREDA